MSKTGVAASEPNYRDRQFPRCELRLTTKMELEDGRAVDFRMSNISQNGIGGHSIEPAPIGSEVEVVLPKIGAVHGRVVWQIGTAVGARLFSELSVNQILGLALDNMKASDQPITDKAD